MSFDADSAFESDFGNSPEGFSDHAEDWTSDGAIWSEDGDGPAEVMVTNPDDFEGGYRALTEAIERFDDRGDDDGGGGGWDDPPYGPDSGPIDPEDGVALAHEWHGEGLDREAAYVPEGWSSDPAGDTFNFADEQGDPEDEKDQNDEHNGFFGRWLG